MENKFKAVRGSYYETLRP